MVLASAESASVQHVANAVGVSRPMVWRWQQRFAEEGVDGLLRDKTRPPGTPPTPSDVVARVVALTCGPPPHQPTHWTGRAMAKASGISLRSVQRIWEAHQLQPHRIRTFNRLLKNSNVTNRVAKCLSRVRSFFGRMTTAAIEVAKRRQIGSKPFCVRRWSFPAFHSKLGFSAAC